MAFQPYLGTSKQRLVALINSDNNATLVEGEDFTLGAPSANSGPEGRNTKVTLTPTNSSEYTPSDLRYTRLSIAVLSTLASASPESITPVEITEIPFSIHGILDDINTALGLNLTPEEVQDQTFSAAQIQYPLTIVEGSYAWLPSTYNFSVTLSDGIETESGDPLLTETGFPFELESGKAS